MKLENKSLLSTGPTLGSSKSIFPTSAVDNGLLSFKGMEMKELPTKLKKRGIEYELVTKSEHGYVYALVNPKSGFDVFRRRVTSKHPLSARGENLCDEKTVSWPTDRSFGKWAWHCMTIEQAVERLKSFGL